MIYIPQKDFSLCKTRLVESREGGTYNPSLTARSFPIPLSTLDGRQFLRRCLQHPHSEYRFAGIATRCGK